MLRWDHDTYLHGDTIVDDSWVQQYVPHSTAEAISYGRVLKTEKLTRNCVLHVLSRISDPESDRIRLALLRILALLGRGI